MAKKRNSSKSGSSSPIGKQAGKQHEESKPEFYHKHKSTIWTIIVLILLAIFFIVNNTRKIPEHGAYPPNYNGANSSGVTTQP